MKTTVFISVCLVAALAPYAAEALNCKSCLYAELDDTAVDWETLNAVLTELDMEVKCKSTSSSPSTQCPSDTEHCVLLTSSATIDLPDGDSVNLNTVYRECYNGEDLGVGCADFTGDTAAAMPGQAGQLMTSLDDAGVDVSDVDGRVCVCDKNNCNKDEGNDDEDDEGGATAVSVTLLTLAAAVAAGLMCTEL